MRNLSVSLALLAVVACGTPAAGVRHGVVVVAADAGAASGDGSKADAQPDPVDALTDAAPPADVAANADTAQTDVPPGPAPGGMALIPAGTFWMGCNAAKDKNCETGEKPQHRVTLSAYYIDFTETTVAQYKKCVDAGLCTAPKCENAYDNTTWGVPGMEQHPVNCVSRKQAGQYCKSHGPGYDLPTEAQWEMAARGSCEHNGSTSGDANCKSAMRTYPWGDAPPDCHYAVMWAATDPVAGCGTGTTWPVGSKPAGDSPYGLHDMAGNICEWTQDFLADYTAAEQLDPVGDVSDDAGAERSASFAAVAADLRVSYRSLMGGAVAKLGLRCVRAFGGAAEPCNGVVCPELPCAKNICEPDSGVCVATAAKNGTACEDGNACTVGDTCSYAYCEPGAVTNCDDGNGCTTESCEPIKGCQHTDVASGTLCTGGGKCVAGACP